MEKNNIIVKQNSEINITRLRAQRELYSSAKRLTAIQLCLSVPFVILISFVALIFGNGCINNFLNLPQIDLSCLVGGAGLLLVILDVIWLNPSIKKRKNLAAKIQQIFDCSVLGLKWNNIIYGQKPNHETVEQWSEKFKDDEEKLHDWYAPVVDSVSLSIARLICQKTNCWWDKDIRTKYNQIVILTGILLFLSLTGITIFLNISMQNFFSIVVAPFLPFLIFSTRVIEDNKNSIERLTSTLNELNSAWDQLIKGTIIEKNLEQISFHSQYGIYTSRKENPLIFNWLYTLSRGKNEKIMNRSSEHYVNDYKKNA